MAACLWPQRTSPAQASHPHQPGWAATSKQHNTKVLRQGNDQHHNEVINVKGDKKRYNDAVKQSKVETYLEVRVEALMQKKVEFDS